MSILDQILGGSDSASVNENSNSSNTEVGTNPGFGLSLDDVLHSKNVDDDGESSEFTGIGGLDVGFSAPSFLGLSSSSENSSAEQVDGNSGGLLGGLL